jgi:AcrR family transcriptional regulator
MTDDGPAARLRADAQRNRDRILLAAEQAFADEGLGVPVDEIARRAGVGPGTLYRNFPTKEALFEAVLRGHMESLAGEAAALATSDRPGDALFTFVRRLSDEASSKRNLVEALLGAGLQMDERLRDCKQEIERAAARLLVRAQRAGDVREDVTVDDLFGMVMGCALSPPSADPAAQTRMVSVLCAGLRPEAHPA